MNFRDTIGHAIEAAATGAVGVATSIMAYIKQVVTQIGDVISPDTNVNTSLHEIKHKDANHTFSASTDSNEAIRDELDSATYGLSNIHIHIDDVDTDLGEPGTGDTSVNSSMHDIRHKDASHTFSATTDSLEAISDELGSGTYGLSAIETLVDGVESTLGTPAGVSVSADIAAVKAETASILTVVDTEVSDILTDTGTTIPGTITTMQGNVTDILTDTGTTIPGTITTMQGNVTDILTDTGTTLPGTLTTIQNKTDLIPADIVTQLDTNVPAILEDTGTTLPATLATISGYTDKIDDATDGLTAIKAEVEGLAGAAMRGTDNAALASVLGAAVGVSISADIAAVKAEVEGIGGITPAIVGDAMTLNDTEHNRLLKTKTSTSPLTTGSLFTWAGSIGIVSITGRVSTIIEAQATTVKLSITPDALAAYDICTTKDINAFAVGSLLSITGTAADAMIGTTAVGTLAPGQASMIIATCITSGTITVTYGAASTGAIVWEILWIPLNAAGTVAAA